MLLAARSNLTDDAPRHDEVKSSGEGDEDAEGQTVTICISLSIVAVIIGVCAIMCYREVSRRKKEALIIEEHARRESIKRSIKDKLRQLEISEDSNSYKEHMEVKVPLVQFSDVIQINPAATPVQSMEDLDQINKITPPPGRKRLKRPQRPLHMYQSYYDNIIRLQHQRHRVVVKIPPQEIAQFTQQTPQHPSHNSSPAGDSTRDSCVEGIHSKQTNGACRRLLHDDVSQHPLGMPLERPPTNSSSWYSYIKNLLPRQEFSDTDKEHCTDIAMYGHSHGGETHIVYVGEHCTDVAMVEKHT
ncbi:unnamed protein product [Lymnaea stagnalis]|uniref:Uncharacterized protein n=1 Tax=Lymnaea stagnalis TaxID=6523 RepID=A0AAV2HM90_LYMST